MNILIDELPNEIKVNNETVKINSDFHSCLPVIMAFEDNELTTEEKIAVLFADMFPEPPEITQELIEAAMLFLNCGDRADGEAVAVKRVYSFNKDANFIYAAFRQTHGIDLRITNLHWWEFVALFMDLGSDTTFCQLVGLRKRLADGKALPEEQSMAAASPELFDIEQIDTSSVAEKELYDEFMRLLAEGQK